MTTRFVSQGHLIDSGRLTRISALVVAEGQSPEIGLPGIARRPEGISTPELGLAAPVGLYSTTNPRNEVYAGGVRSPAAVLAPRTPTEWLSRS